MFKTPIGLLCLFGLLLPSLGSAGIVIIEGDPNTPYIVDDANSSFTKKGTLDSNGRARVVIPRRIQTNPASNVFISKWLRGRVAAASWKSGQTTASMEDYEPFSLASIAAEDTGTSLLAQFELADFFSTSQTLPSFFDVLNGEIAGTSGLTIYQCLLDGDGGCTVSDGLFTGRAYTVDGADLVVSQIPIPAAFWMFGTGLLGLFGVARRKLA